MKTALAISVAFAAGFATAYKRDAIYAAFNTIFTRRCVVKNHVCDPDDSSPPHDDSVPYDQTETVNQDTDPQDTDPQDTDPQDTNQVFEWRTTNSADYGIYRVYMSIFILRMFDHK
jgi:hypothetical protein